MNKRIKKLAEQAMVLDDDELFVREVFDKEKFAELIIRECAIICKESGDVPAVLVSEDILLHFGVEE
jgi:hypothetical protein